jgi:hypothetical protein
MHLKNIFKFLFFPEDSGNRFAKIYYRPNVFTVIRNFPYLIFKNNDFTKSYFRDYKFARFYNAKITEQNPPIIELLICSTQKVFIF